MLDRDHAHVTTLLFRDDMDAKKLYLQTDMILGDSKSGTITDRWSTSRNTPELDNINDITNTSGMATKSDFRFDSLNFLLQW